MFKFSAVSQIWKKYIQKLNDWDLPLKCHKMFETEQPRTQRQNSTRQRGSITSKVYSIFVEIMNFVDWRIQRNWGGFKLHPRTPTNLLKSMNSFKILMTKTLLVLPKLYQ